jgi:hypothetical protein
LTDFKGWANGLLTNWTPPGPPRIYTEEEKAAFVAERPDLLEWNNKAKALPIAIRGKRFKPRVGFGWRGFHPTAPAKKPETWPPELPKERKKREKLEGKLK